MSAVTPSAEQVATPPADTTPQDAEASGRLRRAWRWFALFRRTRPFWGSIWLGLGGWIIMSLTFAPLQVTLAAGVGGMSGYILGGGMLLFAGFGLFAPSQRQLAGLLGVGFAIAALVLSNLGGFIVGMLLGVLGGGMVFAWGPKPERPLLRRIIRREQVADAS
ncbi:DUF6114 domain-containing protein [Haloechinothrix halophila]|uniref:DUF6114 domain-containing protein n=1 Tax=Haloechinothrix halophila TaxID=1069073 RepID=UPI000413E448|nr:DUF6114 domain-containing protein [Haloechinothrix halophila]